MTVTQVREREYVYVCERECDARGDCLIKRGTFDLLLCTDPTFLRTFFLTYRQWMTPVELLTLITKQYPQSFLF